MNAVLGLSVTPSGVGVVLVEGSDDDRVTLDGERFEIRRRGQGDALTTSEKAAAAVLRSEAIAADLGRRVHSIGVTWSDDADAEAALLLDSLNESGFGNVVPVRLSEATDALARRIAHVLGYATTAVCVIEPEQLIALVVSAGEDADDAVQTAVNHNVVTEEDLVGWLSAVFTRADWEPEALVLVGSAEDLDDLLPLLEDALGVPVFSPDQAQLALARGAALACAQPGELTDCSDSAPGAAKGPVARRCAQFGPAALLIAGVVTFVVSASAALALQLAPEPAVAPTRPVVEVPASVAPAPVWTPTPVSPPAPIPAVETGPEEAIPAEEVPTVEVPTVEVPPVVVPSAEAPALEEAPPEPLPPVDAVPAPAMVPPVPEERPGILQRIRDRIGNRGDAPEQAPPAPAPPLP